MRRIDRKTMRRKDEMINGDGKAGYLDATCSRAMLRWIARC